MEISKFSTWYGLFVLILGPLVGIFEIFIILIEIVGVYLAIIFITLLGYILYFLNYLFVSFISLVAHILFAIKSSVFTFKAFIYVMCSRSRDYVFCLKNQRHHSEKLLNNPCNHTLETEVQEFLDSMLYQVENVVNSSITIGNSRKSEFVSSTSNMADEDVLRIWVKLIMDKACRLVAKKEQNAQFISRIVEDYSTNDNSLKHVKMYNPLEVSEFVINTYIVKFQSVSPLSD